MRTVPGAGRLRTASACHVSGSGERPWAPAQRPRPALTLQRSYPPASPRARKARTAGDGTSRSERCRDALCSWREGRGNPDPAVVSWFDVGARMLRRAVGSTSRRPFAPLDHVDGDDGAIPFAATQQPTGCGHGLPLLVLGRRLLKLDPDFRFGVRGVCWRLVRRRPSKRSALCPVAVARAALSTLPLPIGIAVCRAARSPATAVSSRSGRSLMSGLAECSLRSKAAAPGVTTASMVGWNCRARRAPIVSTTASSRWLATGL